MKLGITGPIELEAFRDHLDIGSSQYTSLPQGLGGTPVIQLALTLLEWGQSLTLFTLDRSVRRELVFDGPNLKICIGPYRASRARERARDFFRAEREYLCKAIRREAPDVVHAHWTYEFALGGIASGVPCVVTAHDAPLSVLHNDPTAYRFIRTLMAFQVARKARHLTAVSPYLAEHWRKLLRYPRPISVVPNGLPESLFGLVSRRPNQGRRNLTFATVLNGWSRLKNGKVALQAFNQVHKAISKARLLMFGLGHGTNEEGAIWARKRGLDKGVEFVGVLPHAQLMWRLANEVDVLIHPSLEESFGMSIVEALALGVPTIGGARSGGVPHTLEEGRVGLLVDVRSPEVTAQAMLRLARDPSTRNTLGQAGRESVWRRFHVGHVADAYRRIYETVLATSEDQ